MEIRSGPFTVAKSYRTSGSLHYRLSGVGGESRNGAINWYRESRTKLIDLFFFYFKGGNRCVGAHIASTPGGVEAGTEHKRKKFIKKSFISMENSRLIIISLYSLRHCGCMICVHSSFTFNGLSSRTTVINNFKLLSPKTIS